MKVSTKGDATTAVQQQQLYLSIYACIIYPAFVAPWFPRSVYALKFSMYFGIIYMLTCVIYHCTDSTEQQG